MLYMRTIIILERNQGLKSGHISPIGYLAVLGTHHILLYILKIGQMEKVRMPCDL